MFFSSAIELLLYGRFVDGWAVEISFHSASVSECVGDVHVVEGAVVGLVHGRVVGGWAVEILFHNASVSERVGDAHML